MRAGLCSVTLRAFSSAEVIATAADAGLRAIEWGADVHAPPTDPVRLARVGGHTRDAGLAVASYGSYLALGTDSPADRAEVLAAAVTLGAPRVRVWAGRTGSAVAGARDRAAVSRAGRDLARRAADVGVQVGLEFHGGTLTDTPRSTLDLLSDVDHPAMGTYWQPPVGVDDSTALAGLDALLPHLRAVHAFSWWPGRERQPLAARPELWRGVAQRLTAVAGPVDVLLEFVPDDDRAGVRRDAAALRSVLAAPDH